MEPIEAVDSLGLCEHCCRLISMTNYACDDTLGAKWMCACGKEVTHLSFGYDTGGREARKVRWVGPDGAWTGVRPTEMFRLDDVQVIMQMPAVFP